MLDILTIGSATKDVFLVSRKFQLIRSEAFSTGMGECVSLGSEIEVEKLVETTGGGGTNAAVTFVNLGFKAAVVTRIASDAAGRDVSEDLERYGIEKSFVKKEKRGSTGYSTLLTTEDGERSVLVYRGVSADFEESDLPKRANMRWLYVSSLAGNLSLMQKILSFAKSKKACVAYNPGGLELKRGLKAFERITRGVDVLVMNMEEAQLLTETKSRDTKKLASLIGPKSILVITDGENGAYAFCGGQRLHARTTGRKGISRTGAGDAFASGVVAGLMKEMSLEDAMRIGTANAESVIMEYGAKRGILKSWPRKAQLKKISVRKIS